MHKNNQSDHDILEVSAHPDAEQYGLTNRHWAFYSLPSSARCTLFTIPSGHGWFYERWMESPASNKPDRANFDSEQPSDPEDPGPIPHLNHCTHLQEYSKIYGNSKN